jgi:16S rRNA (uracil1498-N3)-methyltransferase
MPIPRLFLDQPFRPGARLVCSPDQAGYLTRVMRLQAGGALRVFNGQDGEWAATLAEVGRRGEAVIALDRQTRVQAATPDLWLLFAPVKRQATDLIVEKATELGASRLQPVITRRTIAETVRLERLLLIAREAAEQTERLDLPAIAAPMALAKALGAWAPGRLLLFADEAGECPDQPWGGQQGRARPIAEVLAAAPEAPLAVLIGPEGGFDVEERRAIRSHPAALPVSLGPRILRAETAVIAALAVIQALKGDWRERVEAP